MTDAEQPDHPEPPHPPEQEHPRWRDRALRVGKGLAGEWKHDRVPDLAAEVAFYAILSLFPAVLAMASLLGVLDSLVGGEVALEARTEVLEYLGTILTDDANALLETAEELFTTARPGLLTFSLLTALWALSRGFAALVRALDIVYDLDEQRGWFSIRLTALGLAVGSVAAGAIMLSMFVVGPLFGSGEQIAGEVGLGDQFVFLWDVVRFPAAFLVLVLWAATIFHLAPDHHTPWRWDVPGALVTGLLWILFSLGLNLYLQLSQSGGNAIFGALGGALIVLLWFWVLSLAVLIGGEVNEILYREFAVPGDAVPRRLRDRLSVRSLRRRRRASSEDADTDRDDDQDDDRDERSDGEADERSDVVEGPAERADERAGVER